MIVQAHGAQGPGASMMQKAAEAGECSILAHALEASDWEELVLVTV